MFKFAIKKKIYKFTQYSGTCIIRHSLGNGNYVGLANCRIIQVKFQCKPPFNPKFCVEL